MRTFLTLVGRGSLVVLASLLSTDLRAQGPDRTVLQGIVVDVLGSPVGDASVVVRTAAGTEAARVTTDAAGHYRIEVPGLSAAVLAIARDGFEPRELPFDAGRSAQPLRVVLAVAGVVLAVLGTPAVVVAAVPVLGALGLAARGPHRRS